MSHPTALPFTLSRNTGTVTGGDQFVSTTERVHGLLRIDGDRLVVQWRSSRETVRVGYGVHSGEEEKDPVREAVIPLEALAGATVRWIWTQWPPGRYLVLTGADLRAFEEVGGEGGLPLPHPAQLVLGLRRADRLPAREFAGELELALADRALRAAEEAPRLPAAGDTPR